MRVALSTYRGNPHSGGQGIYVRHLSRELVALGHQVEVFSGPPYPQLDEGVALTPVPSLDLYRPEDPFRRPARHEFRDRIDVLEYAIMCTAGFPEPRTFSHRLARIMATRAHEFDVLHDNQTLGPGLLTIARRGLPVLTTVHHPITRDRRLELDAATGWRRVSLRRWYGFVGMQGRVARRSRHLLTVCGRSAADVVSDFKVPAERLRVVPVGVDAARFAPGPTRVPGRLVTVTSADVPLKGLHVLLAALRLLADDAGPHPMSGPHPTAGRHPTSGVPAHELIVVGSPGERTRAELASGPLAGRVRFVQGLSQPELAELMGSAQLLVVPSLYEGFCLPALEAMACATPVLGTDVGALGEILGHTGEFGAIVPPGDPRALATELRRLLEAPELCRSMGSAARRRVETTYSWSAVAAATADVYETIVRRGATVGQGARR